MRRCLVVLACAGLISACAELAPSGTAGETPIPPKPGGEPSIHIAVSGAVTGSTTLLANDHTSHCSSIQDAETISVYSMNLYPVIGGTDYHLSVIVARFHGPVALNVPADNSDGDRITVLFSDAANNGQAWGMNSTSSGTVVIGANGGGSVDLKRLPAVFGTSTVDLTASWTC